MAYHRWPKTTTGLQPPSPGDTIQSHDGRVRWRVVAVTETPTIWIGEVDIIDRSEWAGSPDHVYRRPGDAPRREDNNGSSITRYEDNDWRE